MKRGMRYYLIIHFIFHFEELTGINFLLCFFFLFNCNFDFFLSAMTNNQTKCGITYEKIAMRADDDERMIMSGLIG